MPPEGGGWWGGGDGAPRPKGLTGDTQPGCRNQRGRWGGVPWTVDQDSESTVDPSVRPDRPRTVGEEGSNDPETIREGNIRVLTIKWDEGT